MPNEKNTPKTYPDMGFSEFSAGNIYMNNDCVYLGDALYVCIKDTNHLASAPVPPNPEYWLEFNLDEDGETNFDITEEDPSDNGEYLHPSVDPAKIPSEKQDMPWDETPDTAPLLLPEDAEPFPPLTGEVTFITVAPKKKGGKKK